MLDRFLEQNETYNVRTNSRSERVVEFFLYNNNYDSVEVYGIRTNKLHKKYKDQLKDSPYGKLVANNPWCDTYLIDGEIYRYRDNKLTKLSGMFEPILVQQLKTKTKVLANGYEDVATFVRLLVINGNMKGTKEKKRADRPLNKYVRPGELGLPLTAYRSWNGSEYLTFKYDQRSDNLPYDLPVNEMKALMRDNLIKLDQNYHIVVKLPKVLTQDNIVDTNNALMFEFGERNGKPIFEVQLQQLPSLKGEDIC